jgi:hypothetical protein
MFGIRDLFQWERYVTPSIVHVFYWLALAVAVLAGLRGLVDGVLEMTGNIVGGIFAMIGAVLMTLIGVVAARIVAELVLIVFRIDDHLGEIRRQGDPR